jgi:hypothetical protein
MDRRHFYRSAFNGHYFMFSVVLFALLTGGIIYILYRPHKPLFFDWFHFQGIINWLNFTQTIYWSGSTNFHTWIIFSLPTALWAFAYSSVITRIWSGNSSSIKHIWYGTIPILVFGFEVLQFFGLIRGTYCPIDIAMGTLGIIAGTLFGNKTTKSTYHEKANT